MEVSLKCVNTFFWLSNVGGDIGNNIRKTLVPLVQCTLHESIIGMATTGRLLLGSTPSP